MKIIEPYLKDQRKKGKGIPLLALYFLTSLAQGQQNPKVIELPAIVVTAESDRESQKIISGSELSQVAGGQGDPLKALSTLPGMTTRSDRSSDPAIRGSGPRDNLYFMDFQRLGYLFHYQDLFSVFNADLVKEVCLTPSAFGSEYDSTNGGIIDVKLRAPCTDRLGMKLNINLFESDILVEGPLRPGHSFFAAARRSYIDIVAPKMPVFGPNVDILEFPKFYDYQGNYRWRLAPSQELSFWLHGAWDKIIIDVNPNQEAAKKDPETAGRLSSEQSYHGQGNRLAWGSGITVRRQTLADIILQLYSRIEQVRTRSI